MGAYKISISILAYSYGASSHWKSFSIWRIWHYNTTIELETPNSSIIKEICLIRPTNTTHCVNPEQRYIGLEFGRKSDSILQASISGNVNLAPPGYYMLFISNTEGVPSIAHFIRLVS